MPSRSRGGELSYKTPVIFAPPISLLPEVAVSQPEQGYFSPLNTAKTLLLWIRWINTHKAPCSCGTGLWASPQPWHGRQCECGPAGAQDGRTGD